MSRFQKSLALDFGSTNLRLYQLDTKEFSAAEQKTLFSQFQKLESKPKHKKLRLDEVYTHGMIMNVSVLGRYIRFVLLYFGVTKHPFVRLKLLLLLPPTITSTTKQLWVEACESIGVTEIMFCSTSIAAAVGAGYSYPLSSFAMVIELGMRESFVSAISLYSPRFSIPLSCTGLGIFESIRAKLFSLQRVVLSPSQWSIILSQIGAIAESAAKNETFSSPALAELLLGIQPGQIIQIVSHSLEESVLQVHSALERLDIEERAVCVEQGIVLTGGLACQAGFSVFFSKRLGLPVYTVNEPEESGIRGAAILLQWAKEERSIES